MRLNGFFKGNSPYILISVRAKNPKIMRQINFQIDTGSDITGISYKDCMAMGISFNKLGRPVISIQGLKEKARRWEVKNAKLIAITSDKQLGKFEPMDIFIMETNPDCPSLLGRDFLEKFKFKLFCDILNRVVYLEN